MGAADFRFDGKRVLVVGGATGMGAAAARTVQELGGEVVVMDVQDVSFPVTEAIHVDLTDQQSVDSALAQVSGPIFALFSCAGVPDGVPGLPLINFIAHRHIIERLASEEKFEDRASITLISSTAGIGWENQIERALDFLSTPDWNAAEKWIEEHDDTATYHFSKQAVSAMVTHQAVSYGARGIRLNGIMPGPTDTAFAAGNEELFLGFGKEYREQFGHGPFTADEMGDALVFLGSNAARGIAGELVNVDLGQVRAAKLGVQPDPIVDMLLEW